VARRHPWRRHQLNGVMAKSQPVMSKRCTMKRLKAQSSNEDKWRMKMKERNNGVKRYG
jgi:hypothetical protein